MGKIGQIPWNTGLTKYTDNRLKKSGQKISQANKGQIPWNKGKTNVYTIQTLKKLRLIRLANFRTEQAIQLYKERKSCYEIAKIFNCSYSAVWRRLSPFGILRDKRFSLKGKNKSKIARENMTKAQQKRFSDPTERAKMRGKNNFFYGKKHKPESIQIMKEKLSILLSGAKNPQWRGGLSFEPYGIKFNDKLKQSIRQRDNFQCQECGRSQISLRHKLAVHHIDYDKKNNTASNLISLCHNCHMKTNFERIHWQKYFQKKIKKLYDYH